MWSGSGRLIFYILSAQYEEFINLVVVRLTTLKETPKNTLATTLKGAVVAQFNVLF
jgi:hypothetical protein